MYHMNARFEIIHNQDTICTFHILNVPFIYWLKRNVDIYFAIFFNLLTFPLARGLPASVALEEAF